MSSNVGGCGGARVVAFEPASGQLTSRSAVGSGGGGLPLVAAPLAAIAADGVRRLAVVDGEIVNQLLEPRTAAAAGSADGTRAMRAATAAAAAGADAEVWHGGRT